MKTVMHRSMHGSRIRVDLPDEIAPTRAGTTVSYYVVSGSEREFTAGPRDLGAAIAADYGITLTENLRMRQGTLRVGSAQESWIAKDGYRFTHTHTVVAWEGDQRSVHAHLFDATTSDAVALFDKFTIVETDDGVQMVTRATEAQAGQRPESLLLNLPVLGLMLVRKRAAVDDVPSWPGSVVTGGEAYCDKKDSSRPAFMLASDSAVSTVMPDAPPAGLAVADLDAHWQRSIDLISLMTVGWSEA